ncbi:hypothetical protein Tco_0831124 [Tanacetum coccineum]
MSNHLRTIFDLLMKEIALLLNSRKCEFLVERIHFCGHVLNQEGIHVTPSKIEAVKNLKAHLPTKNSFLPRFQRVYADSIENFLQDSQTVNLLTQKNKDNSNLRTRILEAQKEAQGSQSPTEGLRCLDRSIERRENPDFKFGDRVLLRVSPGRSCGDLVKRKVSTLVIVGTSFEIVERMRPVEIVIGKSKKLKRIGFHRQSPLTSRRGAEFTWE